MDTESGMAYNPEHASVQPVPHMVTRSWTVLATSPDEALSKAPVDSPHQDLAVRRMPCHDWPRPCTHWPIHAAVIR